MPSYEQQKNGAWKKRKSKVALKVLILGTLTALLIWIFGSAHQAGALVPVRVPPVCRDDEAGSTDLAGCKEEAPPCPDGRNVIAYVTAYSKEANPGIDASGQRPIVGRTVACPRALKIGMSVLIENHEYICTDHTALRYDGRYDRFVTTTKEALAWGKRKETVTICPKLPSDAGASLKP